MIIGIDLGTTNSLVACFKEGKVELIPNRLGKYLTPSVVSVHEDGTVFIGETAKEYGTLHPLSCASVFKRSMGTDKEYVLGNKKFRAEELSSLVIRSLKEDAQAYLNEEISEAIISVPAYFNDLQRKATKKAGELAGLNVSRIINEPTAAAIACGMENNGVDVSYMVFDLGGGTFDVSILEQFGSIMEVHAIAGDNFVGGEDFTSLLAMLFLEKINIIPESLDLRTMNEVMKAAEECKCAFSQKSEVKMSCMIHDEQVEVVFTLDEYELACASLLEKLRRPIERSLKDARVSLDDIDHIVLVGGATRLPIIQRFVTKLFKRECSILVDPDKAVVIGAAMQCGMKARDQEIKELVLTDVCPYTLGTEVMMDNGLFQEGGHYLPIIERNTVIPVSRKQTVCTAHDDQTRLDIKILQGESRLSYNNLLLGELSVPVPKGPKGKEAVDIIYTYDVNALLEVEVKVQSTGIQKKIIIQNDQNKISEEEAIERFKQLQYLKQDPREEEANRLQILRAERLYEEAKLDQKESIDQAIMEFERVLHQKDRSEIDLARRKLSQFLDDIEFGSRFFS